MLCKEDIRKLILEKKLIENYIDLEKQLQPNGFDCTLHSIYSLSGEGRIDFDNKERVLPKVKELEFKNDWIYLEKGFYKARINEVINLPNDVAALARPRSTMVRCGVNVLTAVWDAGYRGRSEVGLAVYRGVWIKKNARIVQLVFFRLSGESEGYKGIYQNEGLI